MNLPALKLARAFGLAVTLAAFAPLTGCQSPGSGPIDPVAAGGESPVSDAGASTNLTAFKADMIRIGDRLTITFSGLPTPLLPHEEVVPEDGHIKPPYLQAPVMASGKTVGELQDELHTLYVPAIFKSVTITVKLPERYFFVGGEVKIPGQKPYLTQMTAVSAIQAAGDFTDFGNRRKVNVTRTDGTTVIVDVKKAIKNPKLDIPIYPGDKISVPRRW